MKKKELIERIAEEAGVHFEAFEQVVTEALKGGEEVQITGFGKFSVRERKAREGRNPQTGEKIKIAASKVPTFSAGNALKEAV
jgi:DNA-binding protein HU-beta